MYSESTVSICKSTRSIKSRFYKELTTLSTIRVGPPPREKCQDSGVYGLEVRRLLNTDCRRYGVQWGAGADNICSLVFTACEPGTLDKWAAVHQSPLVDRHTGRLS